MSRLRSLFLLIVSVLLVVQAQAQCSICTKTASQLGRQSAEGLNGGIIYLMILPFAIGGYIGFRWWKQERQGNS